MPVSLQQGEGLDLPELLGRVRMGLGWNAARPEGGLLQKLLRPSPPSVLDLDVSALLFDARHQLSEVVWFGQLSSKGGHVIHSGDNLIGGLSDGDDETISLDLNSLSGGISTVVFVLTAKKAGDFARVAEAYCRLVDSATQNEIARYNLSPTGEHRAVVMASLRRIEARWRMVAVGAPSEGETFNDHLPDILQHLH